MPIAFAIIAIVVVGIMIVALSSSNKDGDKSSSTEVKLKEYITAETLQAQSSVETAPLSYEPRGSAPRLPLRRSFGGNTFPAEGNYTVIDTETSGLDACVYEILEIGAIQYRNNQAIKRFHSYIRPEGAIPKRASDINHITWRKVRNAPLLSEIYSDFISFIGTDILVGYNIEFDIKFIQTRAQKDIDNPQFDVLQLVKDSLELDRYKLSDLKQYFNIPGASHSAIDDCLTTAAVFQKCGELPSGQRTIQSYLQEQVRQEERRARIAALEEKRVAQNASLPPAKELYAISSKMTGTDRDYVQKLKEIFSNEGLSWEKVKIVMPGKDPKCIDLLAKNTGIRFFGLKLSGRLKYILLNLPPEDVKCEFICGPGSINEGYQTCRIYVPSPERYES